MSDSDETIISEGNISFTGWNVVYSQVMPVDDTYVPSKYPILNKHPLSALKALGLTAFPNQQSFHPETYEEYAKLMVEIAKMCGFENLSRVDHFMNFIYWKHVKPRKI